MSKQIYVPAPFEGIDVSVPAFMLPPERTPHLVNFLVHEDGKISLRGPVLTMAEVPAKNAAGVVQAGQWFVGPIQPNGNDELQALYWQQPDHTTNTWPWLEFENPFATLAAGPTTGAYLRIPNPASAAGFVATGADRGATIGVAWAPYKGSSWHIGIREPGGASVAYGTRTHPLRVLSRIDGAAAVTSLAANGPKGAQDVAAYAGRLWTAGGTLVGTVTPLLPNTLQFTDLDVDPVAAGGTAGWRLGGVATNPIQNITVGQESSADWILKLVPLEKSMLIIKRFSVWLLTGSGLDSFATRKLVDNYGCLDPRAVQKVGEQVYWVGEEGLNLFDGVAVSNVSQRVNPRLQTETRRTFSTAGYNRDIHLLRLPGDYLWLLSSLRTWKGAQYTSYAYHTPTGRWTQFAIPSGLVGDTFLTSTYLARRGWIGCGRDSVFSLDAMATPAASGTLFDTYYGDDGGFGLATNPRHIDAEFATSVVRAAAPGQKAIIRRVMGESFIWGDTSKSSSTTLGSFLCGLRKNALNDEFGGEYREAIGVGQDNYSYTDIGVTGASQHKQFRLQRRPLDVSGTIYAPRPWTFLDTDDNYGETTDFLIYGHYQYGGNPATNTTNLKQADIMGFYVELDFPGQRPNLS